MWKLRILRSTQPECMQVLHLLPNELTNRYGLHSFSLYRFGKPIRHAQMGFPYLSALLESIPEVVTIRGKNRGKRLVSTSANKNGSVSPREKPSYHRANYATSHNNYNNNEESGQNRHYNNRARYLRPTPHTSPWREYVKGSPLSASSESNNAANYSFFSNTSGSDVDQYNNCQPNSQSRRKNSLGTRSGSLPPPLYPQNVPSPLFSPRHHPSNNPESSVFNFEHPPAALTPPVWFYF